jgi:hypothetical protein
MVVLFHILDVPCQKLSLTPIVIAEQVEEDHCMASTLARFESSGFLSVVGWLVGWLVGLFLLLPLVA